MNDANSSRTSRAKAFPFAQVIGMALLAWALVPSNPYDYYTLLRIVVCAICLYLAVDAYLKQRIGWVWMLGVAAVVYNPIIRVYLTRPIWSALNVATIVLLGATIWTLRQPKHD